MRETKILRELRNAEPGKWEYIGTINQVTLSAPAGDIASWYDVDITHTYPDKQVTHSQSHVIWGDAIDYLHKMCGI